jgi:DNA polymerase III epsilon subunit-like protein
MAQGKNKIIENLLKKTPVSFLDIETSGFLDDLQKGVVLQVGGVSLPGLFEEKARTFEHLVDPFSQGVKIEKEWLEEYRKSKAYSLHGISSPFPGYKGKLIEVPEVKRNLEKLFGKEHSGLLLGYNLKSFDIPFLRERIGWSPELFQQQKIVDVMQIAQRMLPGLESYSLENVAKALKISSSSGYHMALADSQVTLQIFRALAKKEGFGEKSGLGTLLREMHGINSGSEVYRERERMGLAKHIRRGREQAALMKSSYRFEKGGSRVSFSLKEFNPGGSVPGSGLDPYGETPIISKEAAAQIYKSKGKSIEDAATEELFRKKRSEYLFNEGEYRLQRSLEEGVFKGEHSREVLEMARKRMSFWENVDPSNISRRFLEERFGAAKAEILISGRYRDFPKSAYAKNLLKEYSAGMSEFELTGKIPGSALSAFNTSRAVSFGELSKDPGGFFSGLLPSGRSAYVSIENQPGFMKHVFGRTKFYREAGTGKIITPERMASLKVTAPSEELDKLSRYKTKEDFAQSVRSYLRKERKLAKLEKSGKLPIEEIETINPFEYNVGPSVKSRQPLSIWDEEALAAEAFEKSTGAELSTEEKAAGIIAGAESEEEKRKALSDLAEQITGIPSEGGLPEISVGNALDVEKAATERGIVQSTDFYIKSKLTHKGNVSRTEKFLAQMYDWETKRITTKKGKITKIRIRTAFSSRFSKRFDKYLASLKRRTVSLGELSPEQQEEALSKLRPGETISIGKGKRKIQVEEARLENFNQMYLTRKGGPATTLTELNKNIPGRALAEQVFEVYFKKIEGKKKYGVYSTIGDVFIGETSSAFKKAHPPPAAYAKVFEWKGKYQVALAKMQDEFYFSRFGGVEQAVAARREGEKGKRFLPEINSLLDVDPEMRVQFAAAEQENLKKIYDVGVASFEGARIDEASRQQRYLNYQRTYKRPTKMVNLEGAGEKLFKSKFSGKGSTLLAGALGVSAALVTLSAFSSRKTISNPADVRRQSYGPPTDEDREYQRGASGNSVARITPEYSSPGGYTTNIELSTTDTGSGVDYRELSRVMDRHVRTTLGVNRGKVSMNITDHSDRSSDRDRQRKYSNMVKY